MTDIMSLLELQTSRKTFDYSFLRCKECQNLSNLRVRMKGRRSSENTGNKTNKQKLVRQLQSF